MGIRQPVVPVSFRKADRPDATIPEPNIIPLSLFPNRPISFSPIKSARPVLNMAPPITSKLIKNITVVLAKSLKALLASNIPNKASVVGILAPIKIGCIGFQIKSITAAIKTIIANIACSVI